MNGIAHAEFPDDANDAAWQQALAAALDRTRGTLVNDNGALGLQREGQPAFTAGEALGAGHEKGARRGSTEQAAQNIGLGAVGNNHGNTGRGDLAGGFYFCQHAAGPQCPWDLAGIAFDVFADRVDFRQQLGVGKDAGILVIKPVNVRQVDQQVRIHEQRHHGRQIVIVAELDFLHHNGVVLVDNGNDTPFQQGIKGVAGIQIPLAVSHILGGEKDLGNFAAIPVKCIFVSQDESGLTHGGHGLPGRYGAGALGQLEFAHPGGHGAGGNQDNLSAGAHQVADFMTDRRDHREIQTLIQCENVAADFHHDTAGLGKLMAGVHHPIHRPKAA